MCFLGGSSSDFYYLGKFLQWKDTSRGVLNESVPTNLAWAGLGEMYKPVEAASVEFDESNASVENIASQVLLFFDQPFVKIDIQKYWADGRVYYYMAARRSERAEALLDELNAWNLLGVDEEGIFRSKIKGKYLKNKQYIET